MTSRTGGQKISVIIPLLNEEENVLLVYYKTREVLENLPFSYEIIFVDDGSTDNTFELLKMLKLNDKKLVVIKFIKNFGQTAALAAGFKIASGDIAITIDGDLQFDPYDLTLFLDIINSGTDLVCGWRKINNTRLFIKRLPSLIANSFASLLFGLKIHDLSCTFRAYSKSFYKKIYLAAGLHRFIPVLAKFKDADIKEVKVFHTLRRMGKSKYTSWRFPKVIKDAVFLKISELFLNKSYGYLFKKDSFDIDTILF